MVSKIKNLSRYLSWTYSTPPNNPIDGIISSVKFLNWALYLKNTRRYFVGKYFDLDFLYDTKSGECGALYSHQYVDYSLYKFLDFVAKPKTTIIEVGANIGNYSIFAGSKGARVYSFEPNKEIIRIQKSNIILNRLEKNVEVYNQLVSDEVGSHSFYIQKDSLVSSMIYDKKNPGKKITVYSTTLDKFLEEKKILFVDMIKIDVEGAEGIVLAGAAKALKEKKLRVIYWETNNKASKKERFVTKEKLTEYGYEHFAIETNGKLLKLRKWQYGDLDCISILKEDTKLYKNFGK